MNRFEFGDHVTAHGKPEKGVVTETEFWGNALRYFIRFENGGADWHTADELEALAHPDTARLDWLEKQRADAGVWAGSKVHITPDSVKVETPNLRQAIDAAMKPSE